MVKGGGEVKLGSPIGPLGKWPNAENKEQGMAKALFIDNTCMMRGFIYIKTQMMKSILLYTGLIYRSVHLENGSIFHFHDHLLSSR